MTLDQTSIALVDVKTGKTLYENNELPAIRNDPFFQRLYPQQDAMEIKFQGNLFSIQWTDQAWDSPADPDSKDSGSKDSETIADLDKEKFQTNAEARVEKLRANGLAPENPGNQPPR